VQRALHARLGQRTLATGLGSLGLLGHQHLLGRGHHGTDGRSLGRALRRRSIQIIGAQSFFVGTGLGISVRLGTGISA
jgi:hypothetical protein